MPGVDSGRTFRPPPLAPRAQLRWDAVEPIIRRIGPTSTIEVGVGEGAASARIAMLTRGGFVGCELDPASCARASERLAPLGAAVHNALLTEVDPAPADLLCAFEVLEHIHDDEGALREWAQYIRPGGALVLSVPRDPARFGASDVMAGHFRRYDEGTLTALLDRVGMTSIEVRSYNAPLGYALEGVRNLLDAKRSRLARGQSPETLTAASGRTFQFSKRSWLSYVVAAGVYPFRVAQRHWSGGTGLIAVARTPG